MKILFGSYSLDVGLGELCRDGEPIEVQPKALALLQYLIERRDRIVTKDELLDDLWPGQVVTDGVLKRAVHALRLAVGDSGSKQAIIQTRSRRGYRFVATVGAREDSTFDDEPTNPRTSAFVGRALSLGELRSAWAGARSGRGAVVLIAGPAGIGKTRLVDELAGQVVFDDGRVLNGWCDESRGAPPYWPWLQVARDLGGDAADRLRSSITRNFSSRQTLNDKTEPAETSLRDTILFLER